MTPLVHRLQALVYYNSWITNGAASCPIFGLKLPLGDHVLRPARIPDMDNAAAQGRSIRLRTGRRRTSSRSALLRYV
jgi:hypothetical protein